MELVKKSKKHHLSKALRAKKKLKMIFKLKKAGLNAPKPPPWEEKNSNSLSQEIQTSAHMKIEPNNEIG
jgi:hypothetical protein